MKLAFLDLCSWDYDVDTPHERPLGGSQSALAYLTPALAERGHEVHLFTRSSRPGLRRGVHCDGFEGEFVPCGLRDAGFDAAVVLNGPAEAGPFLKDALSSSAPLALWTQHDSNQPAVAGCANPAVREAWDRLVCVSDWQRGAMQQRFGFEEGRTCVLRNGIGPHFEGLFENAMELLEFQAGAPRLAYTSTPFRGLDVLLHAFGTCRERVPAARLEVFSSLAVYQVDAKDDACAELYRDCRDTPGVRYRGSLPQPDLARRLRGTSFLGYPNTFPETSCISVMEALAAGLCVVTTRLGALPETCMGWAELVPPVAMPVPGASGNEELLAFSAAFAEALSRRMEMREEDPEAFAEERFAQVLEVNQACTWRRRAEEWERFLRSALASPR